jgi:RHS repeat-associated protein
MDPDRNATSIQWPYLSMSIPTSQTHGLSSISFPTGYYAASVQAALGETYAFDSLGRVATRLNASGTMGTAYSFDSLGQVASRTPFTATSGGGCYWVPGDDPNNPNTRERVCDRGSRTYESGETFSYDRAGNRTDHGAVIEPGNRVVQFDGFTLDYDADGNLTRKYKVGGSDQRSYWGSAGQLDSVWTASVGTVRYAYDGFGRRVQRIGATGDTTRYVYDRQQVAVETDAAGGLRLEYTYFPGIDVPHNIHRAGGQTSYFVLDALGNVAGTTTQQNGALGNKQVYTAWGALDSTKSTLVEPVTRGFKGRELDPETGQYYMRARWYDPTLGRFTSEDPTGLSDGTNPYRFAANNPVMFRDPTGTRVSTTGRSTCGLSIACDGGSDIGGGRGTCSLNAACNPYASIAWTDASGNPWGSTSAQIDNWHEAERKCQKFSAAQCNMFYAAAYILIKEKNDISGTCSTYGHAAISQMQNGRMRTFPGVYTYPTTNIAGDQINAAGITLWGGKPYATVYLFGAAFGSGVLGLVEMIGHEEAHAVYNIQDDEHDTQTASNAAYRQGAQCRLEASFVH